MADVMDAAFEDPAEREAYEAFVAAQERGNAGFELGEPALVCRWRMAGKKVPMLNRHIRALAARRVNGAPINRNLVSWAKQHIEWSLAEGDFTERDGVLMVVVDVDGQAAMSVGAYEPLADTSLEALAARSEAARREAGEAGVASEALCAVDGNQLLIVVDEGEAPCGTVTLVEQLAQTRGLTLVSADLDRVCAGQSPFLVSDEHGIVPSSDSEPNEFVNFLIDGLEKLRARTR